MFSAISSAFSSLTHHIKQSLGLSSGASFDAQTRQKLETLLLAADVGKATTDTLLNNLENDLQSAKDPIDITNHLVTNLKKLLIAPAHLTNDIYVLVGVNGTGKTTSIAKLAYLLQKEGRSVTIVAADTFRAAAPDQLRMWVDTLNTDTSKPAVSFIDCTLGQDPGAIVFKAIQAYKQKPTTLLIDTAGRLQTNTNLLAELTKIYNVIAKQLPDKKITTLITIDSMTGQNGFEQVKQFKQALPLDGVILTKCDGSGKGGIIFRIAHELNTPITYISSGEKIDTLRAFDTHSFVHQLIYETNE